jgi:hypothetical protein
MMLQITIATEQLSMKHAAPGIACRNHWRPVRSASAYVKPANRMAQPDGVMRNTVHATLIWIR